MSECVRSPTNGESEKKLKHPSSTQRKNGKTPQNIEVQSKLKILCLHGYRQNETMFREKTGAFRKVIGKHADLVFITAPHEVQPINPEELQQVQAIVIFF